MGEGMRRDEVVRWIDDGLLHRRKTGKEIARTALEGTIMDEPVTPGAYGRAVINGVQFALTGIKLEMGRIIFECTLTFPARYAFTVRPGCPAKIYGLDDVLIADFPVPGVNNTAHLCEVRKGDTVKVFLPLHIREIDGIAQDNRYSNEVIANGR